MAKKGYKANRTSFRPGESGNKGGRPKWHREFREKLKDDLDDAYTLLKKLMRSKDKRAAASAMQMYLQYTLGKPTDGPGFDEANLSILGHEVEKLRAEVALAQAKVKEQGGERGGTINVIMPKFDDDKDGEDK